MQPGWTREQLEEICKNGKKFRGQKFYGVDFSGLDLEKADFRGASCPYSDFSNCNCRMMNAEGANFTLTKWHGANLHRANMKDAILSDADMTQVKDFFGITMTMDCRTWSKLKLDQGFWLGFLFYGLLMEPPTKEWGEKLEMFFGVEHYTTLKKLYANRQM